MTFHFWAKDGTNTRSIAIQTDATVLILGEWRREADWTLVQGLRLEAEGPLRAFVTRDTGWLDVTHDPRELRWKAEALAETARIWAQQTTVLGAFYPERARSEVGRWTDQPLESMTWDLIQELRRFLATRYDNLRTWFEECGDLCALFWAPAYPVLCLGLMEGRDLTRVPPILDPILRCSNLRQAAQASGLPGRKTLALLGQSLMGFLPGSLNLFHWSWAVAWGPLLSLDLKQEFLALRDDPPGKSGVWDYNLPRSPIASDGFLAWLKQTADERTLYRLFLERVLNPNFEKGQYWNDLDDLYRTLIREGETPRRPSRNTLRGWHDGMADQVRSLNHSRGPATVFVYSQEEEALEGLTAGDLTLRLPRTGFDLEEAGRALNNCVGSYTRRVAQRESLVVLIEQQGAWHACLEVVEGSIRQLLGERNAPLAPDDDLRLRTLVREVAGILS